MRRVGQSGKPPVLGTGKREFESLRADHFIGRTVAFKCRYRHWWYYLSPKKRRTLRIMNELYSFWWEKEWKDKANKAILDAIVMGRGVMELKLEDWIEREKP